MSAATNHPALQEPLSRREVIQLREWGTERVHGFPPRTPRCLIGTDDDCAVHLSGPDVFPKHAQLTRERQHWLLRALGDAPGVARDGISCSAFALQPGVEVGVGRATLVAEDEHWIALRSFCSRLLGWGRDHMALIDHALRAIRSSMTHRAPLLLCGDSDLVPIAHALHRRALGNERPFVVCDPHRVTGQESVRSAANYESGVAAAKAAKGGSLCVRSRRLPLDFSSALAHIREPDARVQLIVCSSEYDGPAFLPPPIYVPPIKERAHELPKIVDEFALDATAALNVPPESFTPADRKWVLEHAVTSLPEIEKATLRLVALRTSANHSHAAARLGMALVSLTRWIERRKARTQTRR